jgi:hypothetical protein
MSNMGIFQLFKKMFSEFTVDAKAWYPSNVQKNSIRICMASGQELIFTYNSQNSWELKTKLLRTGGKK